MLCVMTNQSDVVVRIGDAVLKCPACEHSRFWQGHWESAGKGARLNRRPGLGGASSKNLVFVACSNCGLSQAFSPKAPNPPTIEYE